MVYQVSFLTHCVMVLPSIRSMRVFLGDRERSVVSKMKKLIKLGVRAGHPDADSLIAELNLIHSLQDNLS